MNRSFYSCLLRNNVKVYEYSTFVHAKCFIIDDDLSIFGSSNLDNRSLKINFENAIIAKDEKLNSNLNNYFDKMLGNSIMIDKQ
jgi:cardiolipin synthase